MRKNILKIFVIFLRKILTFAYPQIVFLLPNEKVSGREPIKTAINHVNL
jgi:hypothetical protein